jgi:phosphatidylserine/phosphatidylglycerophosphate/cardiolipin synthase-like enzyme
MHFRRRLIPGILFLVSLGFLFFSKYLFSPSPMARSFASITEQASPQCRTVLLTNKEYFPTLKEYFQKAHSRIVGTVYLFKTTSYPDNEPAELLRELIAAGKRKVQVELVVDVGSDNKEDGQANLKACEQLRKAGVNVRLDASYVTTHAKTFVIDDRYCFIGSHNLTHSAMTMNEEASVLVDSPEMAAKLTEFVHQIPLSGPEKK